MPNKERERRSLRAVYDERRFANVLHGDSPDFVLEHHTGTRFGVEVTELYDSESSARLEQAPRYFQDLLAGKPHIHKADRDILVVGDADIQRPLPDGTFVSEGRMPVVILPQPDPTTYATYLVRMIEAKSAKAGRYAAGLGHVNLIVSDQRARAAAGRAVPRAGRHT